MLRLSTALVLCLAAAGAGAGTLVDLSAEASRPAANDQVRARVYSEASGANPAELARRVNRDVAEALKLIRARAGISVKSGAQSTWPVYGREQKIDGWRLRSELVLETRDTAAISELLGELQQMRLAVGEVSQSPSPETRRQVEDETTRDAIRAFQARAALVAGQLGKTWQIRQLNIGHGHQAPVPVFRAMKAMAAEAAPVPLEGGESLLTTTVSGQIELAD
ncbi:SIMPL domain-containing protein [Azonexus sp.]|uniref:SIMPL domain-containing protein n=1 Tax=Azonexus sp. TaxID=1872668 RepID=UPI0035AE91AC